MNRNRAIALAFAAGNIVFIMLFPPFDIYSIATTPLPVFGGFSFYFRHDPNMVVNTSVLSLEIFVVLINAGIAWLLLRARPIEVTRRRISLQNATLIVIAVNLTVIVLFPPFESVFAITNASLPTFEGFYFILARQPNHLIVTTILWLEAIFVLVNGALFWLIFAGKKRDTLTAEEARKVLLEMRKRSD